MEKRHDSVFISYRRSTTRHLARLVFNDLRMHQFDPFLDVESIGRGEFAPIILREISARAHFVFLVSQDSLQRCQNPGDWLNREFEEAVRLKRNIVPIYDGKISLDSFQSFLKGSMTKLPDYNSIVLYHEYFEAGMDRLRGWLEKPVLVSIENRDTVQQEAVERKIHEAIESGAPTAQEMLAEKAYNDAWATADSEERTRLFSKAIDGDPSYTAAYLHRGDAYRQLGQSTEAIRDYDRASKLDPKDPEIFMARGRTFKSLGDWLRARKDFDTAEELYSTYIVGDPLDINLYLGRASARFQAGDADAAIADYTHIIGLPADQRIPLLESESGEESRDSLVEMALWRRALLRSVKENHAGVIQDCTAMIRLGRKHPVLSDTFLSLAHTLRGVAHGALGNRFRAVRDLRKGWGDEKSDLLFSAYLLAWPTIGKTVGTDDPLKELRAGIQKMADDL